MELNYQVDQSELKKLFKKRDLRKNKRNYLKNSVKSIKREKMKNTQIKTKERLKLDKKVKKSRIIKGQKRENKSINDFSNEKIENLEKLLNNVNKYVFFILFIFAYFFLIHYLSKSFLKTMIFFSLFIFFLSLNFFIFFYPSLSNDLCFQRLMLLRTIYILLIHSIGYFLKYHGFQRYYFPFLHLQIVLNLNFHFQNLRVFIG